MPPSRATAGAWEYDRDGALAARGQVDVALLVELMGEPYLRLPPPKTTGRELFGVQFGARVWERASARGLADVDIVATLTAFTARSIAQAYRDFLPRLPDEVDRQRRRRAKPDLDGDVARRVASPPPSSEVEEGCKSVRVLTTDDFGLPAEAKEAVAFAVLAFETWHGRPGNLPAATGASASGRPGQHDPWPEPRAAKGSQPSATGQAAPAAAAGISQGSSPSPSPAILPPNRSIPCPPSTWCGSSTRKIARVAGAVAAELPRSPEPWIASPSGCRTAAG